MSPPAPVHFAAPPGDVADAAGRSLGAVPAADSTLLVDASYGREPAVTVSLALTASHGGTDVRATAAGTVDIPFFGWFFRPLAAISRRRAARHVLATLAAAIADQPLPTAPGPVFGLPPVSFSPEQALLLTTASAATAIVSFAGALFGQLNSPISDAFHATDYDMGISLAFTRIGAVIALFAIAFADRWGRRRTVLIGVVCSAVVCAFSAVSPNLAWFTVAQVFQRGFVITTFTVAGIAVVEEAPEGARAYSASMLALAGGFGFSFAVVTLPFGDVSTWGWRIPFGLGAATILLVPAIGRHLAETDRYLALLHRADVARGQIRDIIDRHGRRFVLLGLVAFLTSVFSAPSSSFMNKYLTDVHGFSNTNVAVFRAVTTGIPGLVGLVIGGRLAEARGRRPVAAIALAIATASQMVFFLAGGPVIWLMSAISILTAGASGVALGTLDAELFSTEVRATSNALLVIVGVSGSVLGLLLAGALADPLGGLGRSVALMGVAALLVAAFVVPMLPESVSRSLDEISPTHANEPDEYGPSP